MSQLLPYLLILVCPVTMGLMMWLMMRGMDRGPARPDPRVADLESQVRDLQSALQRKPPQPAADPSAQPVERR